MATAVEVCRIVVCKCAVCKCAEELLEIENCLSELRKSDLPVGSVALLNEWVLVAEWPGLGSDVVL